MERPFLLGLRIWHDELKAPKHRKKKAAQRECMSRKSALSNATIEGLRDGLGSQTFSDANPGSRPVPPGKKTGRCMSKLKSLTRLHRSSRFSTMRENGRSPQTSIMRKA